MAQHDYVLSNASGAALRADVNTALGAIATTNSGTSAPNPTYAYQLWADTNTGLMKMRNGSNNGWVTLYALAWGGAISDGPLILRGNDSSMVQFQNYGGAVIAYITSGGLYVGVGATNFSGPLVLRGSDSAPIQFQNSAGSLVSYITSGGVYVGAGATNFSGPLVLRGSDSAPIQFQNSAGSLVSYITSGGVYVGAGATNFSGSLVLRGSDGTKPVVVQNSSGTEIGSFAAATGVYTPTSPASGLKYSTAQVPTGVETVLTFTGIPSWARRITVMFSGVSTNGTDVVIVKLGTAAGGGGENDYAAGVFAVSDTNTCSWLYVTQGFPVLSNTAASVRSGPLVITKVEDTGLTWVASGNILDSASPGVIGGTSGRKIMPAAVDRVVITTINGANTFDGGGINVVWE